MFGLQVRARDKTVVLLELRRILRCFQSVCIDIHISEPALYACIVSELECNSTSVL